jgi:hypothetical protein
MSRTRGIGVLVPAVLLLAACVEPTAPHALAAVTEPAEDLALTLPSAAAIARERQARSDTVIGTVPVHPLDAQGLAASSTEVAQIWDAKTVPYWGADFGAARGSHRYRSNMGRITTTAHLSFNGLYIGSSEPTRKQQSGSFLIEGPFEHYIEVTAFVNSTRTCGQMLEGRSEHEAWYETVNAATNTVSSWGLAIMSSKGELRQASCAKVRGDYDPTGAHTPSPGMVCHYLITYDLKTFQVYDVQLLYCEAVGGNRF